MATAAGRRGEVERESEEGDGQCEFRARTTRTGFARPICSSRSAESLEDREEVEQRKHALLRCRTKLDEGAHKGNLDRTASSSS